MSTSVEIRVNGQPVRVPHGTVLAAAISMTGAIKFRKSVFGEARGPLCGMGICMECRVTINSQPHCRSCQVLCEEGMNVQTDE